MRQVAVAFYSGEASPVPVPFRTAVVPPGYRLVLAQWEPTEGLPAMTDFRLVDAVEVADPGDRAMWFRANQAVPASALVGGE